MKLAITRIVFLALAAVILVGAVFAYNNRPVPTVAGETAVVTEQGFGGEVTLTLTVADGKVVAASAEGAGETPELGGKAVEQMPAAMVEAGSIEVDGVAGATVTSTAIRTAAKAAMAQLGYEVAAEGETASATAQGFGGDVTVTLTVADGKVVAATAEGAGETPTVGGMAIEQMPAAMVEAGSIDVDGVAGATITSTAIKTAAEAAMAQLGGAEETAAAEEPVEETPAEATEEAVPVEGETVTATAKGFADGDVTVTLTVADGKVVAAYAEGVDQTPELGGKAIEQMPAAMVEAGSIEVDGVAGATLTSTAIKTAAEAAIAQLSGAEEAAPVEETPAEATEEAAPAEETPAEGETVSATAKGFADGDVTVTLTVAEGKVVAAYAKGVDQTPELGGKAIEQMPAAMVEAGSIDVDGIAGATLTSTAIKTAAEAAMAQLSGAEEAAPVEETPAEATEEAAPAEEIPAEGETVSATAKGFADGDVTVTLTVADGKVVAAYAEGVDQTPELGGRAIEQMPVAMVEAGSIDVDGVAGATLTSTAIKTAAAAAMAQLGGAEETSAEAAEGETVTATAKGFADGDVTVTLTVVDGKVVAAYAEGVDQTPELGGRAIEQMPAAMVEAGSIDVDGIAGATLTSTAIKTAAAAAMAQLGGAK